MSQIEPGPMPSAPNSEGVIQEVARLLSGHIHGRDQEYEDAVCSCGWYQPDRKAGWDEWVAHFLSRLADLPVAAAEYVRWDREAVRKWLVERATMKSDAAERWADDLYRVLTGGDR